MDIKNQAGIAHLIFSLSFKNAAYAVTLARIGLTPDEHPGAYT